MLNLGKGYLLSDTVWALRKARRDGWSAAVDAFRALRYLRGGSQLDYSFYQLQLSGTPHARLDPVTHYVIFGVQEGFDPAADFSTAFYLEAHRDVASRGINPFFHYLRAGERECRRIEPSTRLGEIIGRLDGDGSHRGLGSPGFAPEEAHKHRWPLRRAADPGKVRADDDDAIYDGRPDDPVLAEASRGTEFLDRDIASAVEALNAHPPRPTGKPDVSILIPVYGQLAYTLNCLDALLTHGSCHSFEVIVADDASPDDTARWLNQINGIRAISYPKNEGFVATCNKAAATAKGRYLVLLNNDTRVCEGWLDRLIATFDDFPTAGLAGSKLFYPDGSLQEAGGIVWRDGSAWNYGRDDDPNRPRYCHARDADYMSGAAIALPLKVWQEMDGFDNTYRPAYYEDTDLAFRLRDKGYRTIYQPLSRVIHYEGKTSGTDVAKGAKAYQVSNGRTFFTRWRQTLQYHRANGTQVWAERERVVQKRVLIIDMTNPTPGQDAGSQATVNLIRAYQDLGYKVSFVPEDNFLYERDKVEALQAIGVECHYAPYDTSLGGLLGRTGMVYDVVQLIRADVAARNLNQIQRMAPRARILFLNADLHYLRLERQALVENNPALLESAADYRKKEMHLAGACDAVLVHSTVEAEILGEAVPGARVHVLPLTETVPDAGPPGARRKDVMFLGGYNHPPNVDAAMWLLDELWPKLAEHMPEARLLLVGSNPPESLKARAADRILVSGTVPDLKPWFDRARVFVAPLRYGAGAKGKVLAALAHGVPVVATPVAAEGMALQAGKTIFLADTVQALVAETQRLYTLPARRWTTVSKAGRAHIAKAHSFEAMRDVLKAALD
ncbi:glycosyltransferase, partial [Asticcacaulis biprosthecium]|uniref:glycosyltransferase n=1 Tax=Asticcacaulis biprosthecium TaxID=76891 RepID=UPI00068094DF